MAAVSAVKILHVFPTFAVGGQQLRLAALIEGLGAAFRHVILALNGDLSAADRVAGEAEFVPLVTKKSPLVSPSAVAVLKDAIVRHDPDLLCTYNWGAMEAVVANAVGPRKPHIHFEDGFGPDETLAKQNWKRVLVRRVLLRRATLVAPSRGLARLALERWRLDPRRVRYLANGVELARFAVERDYDRAPATVGSVGALRPEKNFARLMRAFDASQAARLVIIGDGPDRGALVSVAAGLGSAARIDLAGRSDAPETAYRAFDIFAMSSDTEQMPLSLMEAMAAGLPVAATEVGDVKAMLSAENRPFVAKPGDEAALANAIRTLAGDSDLRRRLGEANQARARTEFSHERMIAEHRGLYRSLLV